MCRGSVELLQPGAAPRAASGKQWDFIPRDWGCCVISHRKALACLLVCLSELHTDGNASVLTHPLVLSFSRDPSVSGERVGLLPQPSSFHLVTSASASCIQHAVALHLRPLIQPCPINHLAGPPAGGACVGTVGRLPAVALLVLSSVRHVLNV